MLARSVHVREKDTLFLGTMLPALHRYLPWGCRCGTCDPAWFARGWQCPVRHVQVAPYAVMPRWLRDMESDGDSSEEDELFPNRGLIARLEAALEANQQRERLRARLLQPAVSGTCVICFEEKEGGCQCEAAARHFVCMECMPSWVSTLLAQDNQSTDRLAARRQYGAVLRCPLLFTGDCSSAFPMVNVLAFLAPALQRELEAAEAGDEDLRAWQEAVGNNEKPEHLRLALQKSMPGAVQCGACAYGPIDHGGCEDLNVHHWQWQGSSQIKNECPNCGWWKPTVAEWPPWDGELRHVRGAEAAQSE